MFFTLHLYQVVYATTIIMTFHFSCSSVILLLPTSHYLVKFLHHSKTIMIISHSWTFCFQNKYHGLTDFPFIKGKAKNKGFSLRYYLVVVILNIYVWWFSFHKWTSKKRINFVALISGGLQKKKDFRCITIWLFYF